MTITKGHDRVVNLWKLTRNNHNVDLVDVNAYAKSGLIPSNCSWDIVRKWSRNDRMTQSQTTWKQHTPLPPSPYTHLPPRIILRCFRIRILASNVCSSLVLTLKYFDGDRLFLFKRCKCWYLVCILYTHLKIQTGTWRLYNVASASMQRHDVASTLRRRYINVMCPLGLFHACTLEERNN